jgi:hypothetical protein
MVVVLVGVDVRCVVRSTIVEVLRRHDDCGGDTMADGVG